MILAADLGGTKCNLILFEISGRRLRPVSRFNGRTAEFSGIEKLLEDFSAHLAREGYSLKNGHLQSAAFGVAGAIVNGEAVSNNLAWTVTRERVSGVLGLPASQIILLNDVEAAASSLTQLASEHLLPLNSATPVAGSPKLYIAAGTGLGESILFWNGDRYQVSPCEAGLTDFAPGSEEEIRVLKFLLGRMPRVCTEEIVSGRGFRAIHEALFPEAQHTFFDDPALDAAANITQQAFRKTCAACERTLHIWTRAYGSEAGNMALRTLPFGGVYIGGGIALKILPKLQDGTFVRAFCDKSLLSAELARIPIYMVLNQDAPALGAAYIALDSVNRAEAGSEKVSSSVL
jgi:glucokinase